MAVSAVIFDIGGVVRDPAVPILREFETSHGLPAQFISSVVGKALTRANGPQQRLEKGEILFDEFCRVFDEEFAAQGHSISAAEVLMEMSRKMTVRPVMLEAVKRLRGAGIKTAALTNTWLTGATESAETTALKQEFDVYLESYAEGLRKPDPAFLTLACERLVVPAPEIVYLDEIGLNLKPARKMGMTTIKVRDPLAALDEVEKLLGIALRDKVEEVKEDADE